MKYDRPVLHTHITDLIDDENNPLFYNCHINCSKCGTALHCSINEVMEDWIQIPEGVTNNHGGYNFCLPCYVDIFEGATQ